MIFFYLHTKYFTHIYQSLSLVPFPLPPAPQIISLLVLCLFKKIDSANERKHAIFVFLSLAYFS
jgi:hypothetical protein